MFLSRIKQYLFENMISHMFSNEYLIKREEILKIQEAFAKYRGCLTGKKVVIVATGPSLNKYVPMKDAIHIGINKAYKRDDIDYNYYFVQDYEAVSEYVLDLVDIDCVKFAGQYILDKYIHAQIPDSIIKRINATKYYLSYPIVSFANELCLAPFSGASTTVISALQFAAYCQASEIYLVGCDTSCNGYFDNTKNIKMDAKVLINDYLKFKKFVEKYHEDSKIISINPVGLRGIFEDVYL